VMPAVRLENPEMIGLQPVEGSQSVFQVQRRSNAPRGDLGGILVTCGDTPSIVVPIRCEVEP
jgi:hypothetical protein